MRRVAGFCAVLSLAIALPRPAHAHVSISQALTINQGPTDQDVLAATTFGILISHDGGDTWDWLCEPAVGYSDINITPRWVWLENDTIIGTTEDGLAVSTDGACSWTRPDGTKGKFGHDVQVDPSDPATVLATLTDLTADQTVIIRSTDSGATFPDTLYSADGRTVTTIRIAASDPMQIYAGEYSSAGTSAYVLHSVDGGATWDEHLFAAPTNYFRVLGVDPTNPAIVYAASAEPYTVWRSTDSGLTFKVVLSPSSADAFLTDDTGMKVWVSDFDTGLSMSTDRGLTFSPVAGAPLSDCLARVGSKIWACARPDKDGIILATSSDGVTFQTEMATFKEIDSALTCEAGTTAHDDAQCAPYFDDLLCTFGLCKNGTKPPGGSGCCSVPGSGGGPGDALLIMMVAGCWLLMFRRRRAR